MPLSIAEAAALTYGRTEAWMFGKGPSFERVEWPRVGSLRIGINEVANVVPLCLFGFTNHDFRDIYDPSKPVVWVTPAAVEARPEETDLRPLPRHPITSIPDGAAWAPFWPSRGSLDDFKQQHGQDWLSMGRLQQRAGSPVPAVHFLCLAGVKRIHLWGFDGGTAHGRQWQSPNPEGFFKGIGISLYDITLEWMERIAGSYGLELINHRL